MLAPARLAPRTSPRLTFASRLTPVVLGARSSEERRRACLSSSQRLSSSQPLCSSDFAAALGAVRSRSAFRSRFSQLATYTLLEVQMVVVSRARGDVRGAIVSANEIYNEAQAVTTSPPLIFPPLLISLAPSLLKFALWCVIV